MKILVTGASGGIGKAVAFMFLERGHEVMGFDVLTSPIEHENYTHYVCDLTKRDYPAIEGVEAVVNCAGIQSQTEKDIEVNLTSVIAFTEFYAFNEQIKAVVNISSSSALTGAEFPHYAASKGGLSTYTKNLAQRLAVYGACANAICPGAVETDMNEHILKDKSLYDAVAAESLLNKWASPEEIAEWVYFLVCVNRSMTGQELLIDNGEFLKINFIW